MSRRPKDPLRPLTEEERERLRRISRSQSEPAAHVIRAKLILAVAEGQSYTAAAQSVGRRSNDAVAQLVTRFNQEGMAALQPRHGGGAEPLYGPAERERILREVRRTPDRTEDGGAQWTLSLLQKALHTAPDGLPEVSIDTIWRVLHEAGLSWQRGRSWCETGHVLRRRKAGTVIVTDPDTEAKKN